MKLAIPALPALLAACAPETKRAPASPGLPALDHYTQTTILGDLWKRPDLSPRDRSIVTLSVLVAKNQTSELPFHFDLALENGVNASEISEIITHLAFYSGWGNATSAAAIAQKTFEVRGIGPDQLAPVTMPLLPSIRPPRGSAPRGSRRASGPSRRAIGVS